MIVARASASSIARTASYSSVSPSLACTASAPWPGAGTNRRADYATIGAVGAGACALGAIAIAVLYAIVRRVRERWVGWATGVTALFILFMTLVYPVFIAPVFNDYQSLPSGELRDSILALPRGTRGSAGRRWGRS